MKKTISLLLAFAMLISIVPFAYANSDAEYAKSPYNRHYFRISQGGKYLSVAFSSTENLAEITMRNMSDDDSHVWLFTARGNKSYDLTNKKSEKVIDVLDVSKLPGAGLIQYKNTGADNQVFTFIPNALGGYYIRAKHSGLYLTVKGTKITQEEFTGSDAQCFELSPAGEAEEICNMGMTASLFALKGENSANNAKLQWNNVAAADSYAVYRSENGEKYELLEMTEGVMLDDYDLSVGSKYTYKVLALEDGYLLDSAVSNECEPYNIPELDYKVFSNVRENWLERPNSLCVDGIYYRFSQQGRNDGGYGFGTLSVSTSEDDVTYSNETVIMTVDDILSHPSSEGLVDCKFESINYVYNPKTELFYMWAHLEAAGGYGVAKVAVAYGKPGEKFTFGKTFRPEGDDARDMNLYIDEDGSAYLMAAVHNNADLALYKLTEDWKDVERKITYVNTGRWRELPNVLKKDGIYYMFHSGTAGWYPTQAAYNTADSMEGPWSEMKLVGNTNTFSSQSGGVSNLKQGGENSPLMLSYRWMWWWDKAIDRRTANRLLPISVSNRYAFFDYYDDFLYNVDNDILIPVQNGRLLSQGKTATASGNSEYASFANDGNYHTAWSTDFEWPSSWSVDLGQSYDLSAIQISWLSWNGAEPYYNFTVEGSEDGENYTLLLDRSEGFTDYGFTVNDLYGKARYVRLNMLDCHPRNAEVNTSYSPCLYEVKIFGN